MVVDNVIITWLDMTVEDQRVAHDGLGETDGRFLKVFYANDDMVGLMGPGLVETLDEHYGRPLPKVWPCVQRRQVTYNDMPNWNTTV